MNLEWENGISKGDMGTYEIMTVQGRYVSYWTPYNMKDYRAYSTSKNTIEEAEIISQIMEDDMTGSSIMTNEKWDSFLRNADEYTNEVFS